MLPSKSSIEFVGVFKRIRQFTCSLGGNGPKCAEVVDVNVATIGVRNFAELVRSYSPGDGLDEFRVGK